jgi:RNA polymerase sigma-70 factor (family 1)
MIDKSAASEEKHGSGLAGEESNEIGKSFDPKETFLRKSFESDPLKGCELLYNHYFKVLCTHATRYVCSREVASDIVNDVFFTFWEKSVYNNITTSYRAYLFIAVKNRCLKVLDKEFRRKNVNLDLNELNLSTELPSPDEIIQFNELSIVINNVIQNLSPQCRKAFLLSRYEGKKYPEIAVELGITVKTVEAHVSKALNILRKAVQSKIFNFLIFMICW